MADGARQVSNSISCPEACSAWLRRSVPLSAK
jgi:hypothetical protein